MDTDENDSDYKENRHILNNDTRLDNTITNSNNENLSLSDNNFFIAKLKATKENGKSKNLNPNKDTFPILKEQKVNKIVGDISNESALEYYDNNRPSKRTRSQRKK
ncbi:8877_t:CDS:2 [Gigaspora margarita]|uniref:8877_t:CDS:1 n=1 Tax=Gigaspora margarita TaxID=4874 RepID=A0ABN7WPI2_GIGMA|nr:8877_t:CDS:2 [Gigaspora margarita]